jgi:RimJ/RimL family protein N-acetyltransferase
VSVAIPSELAGRLVRLRRLTGGDAPALLASITSDEVWAWKPAPQPRDIGAMETLIRDVLVGLSGSRHPFVVIRKDDGRVIGSTTLYEVDLEQGRADNGWTWLARDCWGQGYNEDMKHTLLKCCFGPLALARVQWTVDGSNLRSQRALERLGFMREGLLRSHRVRVDGTRADTAVYSTVREDWSATATRLQALIRERMARLA